MPDRRLRINRRQFFKNSAAAAALAGGLHGTAFRAWAKGSGNGNKRKKVIVIGVDGMDARLSQDMLDRGELPNLGKLHRAGGFRPLGTSTPPQSPVAWSNFITGAGPGVHGIFDFIHRHPDKQCDPYLSTSETVSGVGGWEVGDYQLPLTFWPFEHKAGQTLLLRGGTPFWDYLDGQGIPSRFYDLPANYPPSVSGHGHHRCLSGMGTPDLLGTYGTYQHFSEQGPLQIMDEGGGKRSRITFTNHTAEVALLGPINDYLKQPVSSKIPFFVHRDPEARAALIEIQKHRILLSEGQWSRWIELDFSLQTPSFMPDDRVRGICRFLLQETGPCFRLYVSPINISPADPAARISEPSEFVQQISSKLGLFYTTGFQEDHKALSNGVFTDEEFLAQANYVLEERLALLDYALSDYDEGLLFFYFSSTDLQAHMFWWDSDEAHPIRSPEDARKYNNAIRDLYTKLDSVVGNVIDRFGDQATIIVMSDHGFTRFRRQFNLNTWLRNNGYLHPANCTSLFADADFSMTRAYGLGINSLYLNLRGRERDGIVAQGEERDALIRELVEKLEAIRDADGSPVIKRAYRSDEIYTGDKVGLAPDIIIGYHRGYRASWETCLGGCTEQMLYDNDSAWSADHCMDASEIPGVLFCNRPIRAGDPTLVDLAPTILHQFGVTVPPTMTGRIIL